jgi:hypothetical protein
MRSLIPVPKAANVVLQVVLAVRDEVADQAMLNRIQARVDEIVGQGRWDADS